VSNADLIEVRLFGGLQVKRSDGRLVADSAWRTSRSADLFRLLAVNAGRPVSVPSILEKFWPDVDELRAKGSLRTALTHLRRAVGSKSVVRSGLGLSLGAAWVDVAAYRLLAAEAHGFARTEQHAALVRAARETESLYSGDFHAADDTAPWVVGVRESLVRTRKGVLSDAADSAVQLRWLRDAVDFAETALALDPVLERGHRALMRAYAGLGETDRALLAFDRCRVNLARSLGADPSPLTTSVHLEILAGPALAFLDQPETEVDALASQLRQVTAVPQPRPALESVDGARQRGELEQSGHDQPPPGTPARRAGDRPRRAPVVPASRDELAQLAETVLAGPVSGSLVDVLETASNGDSRVAMRLLRQWSSRGALVWTAGGLEVVAEDSAWEAKHGQARVVRELERRMTPVQLELMHVVALLGRPVAAVELAALHGDLNASFEVRARAVEAVLYRLADLGALKVTGGTFEPRSVGIREATVAWMRPSVRMQLSNRLADLGVMPGLRQEA
jgi:DNA-binding SARP family transcriptional activator